MPTHKTRQAYNQLDLAKVLTKFKIAEISL